MPTAEFCHACAMEMFGYDNGDFKGRKDTTVICDGCGMIFVDWQGNCITDNCMRKGQEGHGRPDIRQTTKRSYGMDE